MNYRVILMRHAKSSWDSSAASDHERPLNKRGRIAAAAVAARIVGLDWTPDHVVSSDSMRTRETFARMRDTIEYDDEPDFRRDLYHAGALVLTAVLRELPDRAETVLALGHNPGWEAALERFVGTYHVMKTGCAALLHREADSWTDAMDRPGLWQLHSIIYPRAL